MARITDRLVIQRTENQIVFMDDSSGAEIVFPAEVVANVIGALRYLVTEEPALLPQTAMERVVAALETERPDLKVVAVLSGSEESGTLAYNMWSAFEGPDAEQQAAHLLGHAVLDVFTQDGQTNGQG